MGKKKKTPTAGSLATIRIGSRVRCTDDGVEGRITWANAVSVKIKWDDGEQVTWKRSQLASKPLEFLDTDREAEGDLQTEMSAVEPAPEAPVAPGASTVEEQIAAPPVVEQLTTAETLPVDEAETPAAMQAATDEALVPTTDSASAEPLNTTLPGGFAIPKRHRKPKAPAQPKEKKLSAIDGAAKVLAETGTHMTCKELIGAMAAKGYWTSPGGKTPDATLHAAILREITVKGEQSRFVKAAPGRFALRPAAPATVPPNAD